MGCLLANCKAGWADQPGCMRVGYARQSKTDQADALDRQVSRLREAGCDQIIEELISGGDNERPGVLQLIKLIERQQVEEILLTRVDRLGRDAQFADALLAMAAEKGVTIRAIDGGVIESATPGGFLISRVLTTVAEHERRMLSLRIRSQFDTMRKQGRSLRRRVPFGYEQENGQLKPHPQNWDAALQVIEQLDKTRSFSKVSRELPKWNPQWTPAPVNLRFWFVNPVIRGHLPHLYDKTSGKGWNARWKEIYRDQHEPLISESDWRSLSNRLRMTKNNFAANGAAGGEARHALSGICRCNSCGGRLTRNSSAGVAWWRCRHRLCDNRGGAKESELLPIAIAECIAAANYLSQALLAPPEEDPRRAPLLQQLEQLQQQQILMPDLEYLKAGVVEVQSKLDALETQPIAVDLESIQGMQELLEQPEAWEGATPEELRTVLAQLLIEIKVGRGGDPITAIRRPY